LKLLEQVAQAHPKTLEDPPPLVSFEGFGINTITLGLRCYVGTIDDRIPTTTELHQTINDEYRSAGINIAVPQRDVHLNSAAPLEVRVLQATGSSAKGPDMPPTTSKE